MSVAYDDAPRGFVAMRDYLRLQRRCDELEAALADLREDARDAANDDAVNWLRRELRVGTQAAQLTLFLMASKRPLESNSRLNAIMGATHRHHPSVITHNVNRAIRRAGGPEHAIRGIAGCGGGRAMGADGRTWLTARFPQLFAKGASR